VGRRGEDAVLEEDGAPSAHRLGFASSAATVRDAVQFQNVMIARGDSVNFYRIASVFDYLRLRVAIGIVNRFHSS